MNWKPAASPDVLVLRARLLADARRFFSELGVLEVQTPALVSGACPDPNIPAIAVRPADGRTLYLHTSPEHAMKRLLCAGSPDIYQIGPVFRDGETGRYHNPEFTMIEWYRRGFDRHAMAEETVLLIRRLLGRDVAADRVAYRDAFLLHAGVDPFVAAAGELAQACAHHGVAIPAEYDRESLLDLLLGTVVAAQFAGDRLHVMYDYPVAQAALARIRPGMPPVAERFEVFYGGLELANGFLELTDAAEQRERFLGERARNDNPPPLDQKLLDALACGLPDCSGVALGFDRVVMLAGGVQSLSDVMAFPYDRA